LRAYLFKRNSTVDSEKQMSQDAKNSGRLHNVWRAVCGQRIIAMRLFGCFLTIFLITAFSDMVGPRMGAASLFWLANAQLLSYLLLAPRRLWSSYFFAGFLGMASAAITLSFNDKLILLVILLSLLDTLISLLPLRISRRDLPKFSDTRYLTKFTVFALLLGPIVSGLIYAAITHAFWYSDAMQSFLFWTVSTSLGSALLVPVSVKFLRKRRDKIRRWRQTLLFFLILTAALVAAYSTITYPVIFLLYPLLLLAVVFHDLAWGAAFTIYLAVLGGWMTDRGLGPLAKRSLNENTSPGLLQELFIATAIVMLYIVSALMGRRRGVEEKLKEMAHQHQLLTDYSRDVIILSDMTGRQNFVSPACETLTGWTIEEMRRIQAIELLHPDDAPMAKEVLAKMRAGIDQDVVECRIRKKDGGYLWVEASLRLIRRRDNGKPAGILNMVRDISGRKAAEEKLQQAYRALEELAITDPLTGLANRRRFDQALATEWRRGERNQTPLSMLMIDVDLFKSFNDEYGHLSGDECLKTIANAIESGPVRPGDLCCRFGGEEFAVILPATKNVGAVQVANRICEEVRSRRLRHDGNPNSIVTISIGCATVIPGPPYSMHMLINAADHALYQAKNLGRNRVCNANEDLDADYLPGVPADLPEEPATAQ
jgi:diguanylate cyclase (GGDEF)-like protein/PAS domain S-box-containing protein